MKRFSRALTVTAVVMMLLGGSTLYAQFNSGLEGTVYDPTGAVVPNATVTLHEVSTGVDHNTVTTSAGNYRFTAIPPGAFQITVKATGFETAVQSGITIQNAEIRTLNITLKLGASTQEVVVKAAVTPVNLVTAAVSGQINEVKVHELPLVGRNMYSLVVLTPGVTGLPSGGGQAYAQATADIFNAEYGVNLNANGQRAESNNFSVDGATTNGNPRGGVTNLTPNADSIQEVRIQTNNFSAEYGRNAAAIVDVVTKSGSNNYHGTLSWFHSDTHLNSRNIFQTSGGLNDKGAPIFLRNEFAGSIGGPVRKDKDFFFGSIDMLRSGVGLGYQAQVPTPQLINYLKANAPSNISTQVLSSFPTSFQPTSSFTTAGADVGSGCAGNAPIGAFGTASDGQVSSGPITQIPCNMPVSGLGPFNATIFRNGVQVSGRFDHNWNNFKDRLYGSFYRTTRQTVEFASPSVYYPRFSPAEPEYTHLINLDWTHTAGPTFVNEMKVSYTRTFGDAPCDNCQVPAMGSDDGTSLPGNGFIGVFKQNNYEWKDVASVIRGRQTIKFGANLARHHDDEIFTDTTRRPTFQFRSLLHFAADTPYNESNIQFDPRTKQVGTVNVDFAYRSSDLGAFIQDDIKLKPNFTLNLGARWEVFTGPTERFDRLNNGLFTDNSSWQQKIASMKMAGTPQLWHTRMNNVAPRFGFAWDPSNKGKMSIRGGIGMFYDRPENQLYTGDRNNLPLVANAGCSLRTSPACTPAFGLGASGDSPYNFPAVTGLGLNNVFLDSKNGLFTCTSYAADGTCTSSSRIFTSQVVTDPNLKIQYGENWSLGAQYELWSNWVAEADYLGSEGHHMYSSYNVNRFAGDVIQNGGYTGYNHSFGGLFYGQSNYNSHYQGGTLSVHNRGFSHGINFQAAYTFGKAVDQAQTFGPEPVDALNTRAEYGPADFNVSRRFAFSTLWQVPGRHWDSSIMRGFLNGWQISNITILQKGTPFTVFCGGCDYNADGTFGERPDVTGSVPHSGFSKNQFLTGILSASDFTAPAGPIGNVGRNSFTGPGYINTDLSFAKKTHMPWFVGKEGAQAEFRAEFFNAFNNVNLNNLDSDLSSGPSFGHAFGVFPARDIQLGLRIEF